MKFAPVLFQIDAPGKLLPTTLPALTTRTKLWNRGTYERIPVRLVASKDQNYHAEHSHTVRLKLIKTQEPTTNHDNTLFERETNR